MQQAEPIAILIPAAGQSSRMRGTDKLLELVEGETILSRTIKHAKSASSKVIVTISDVGPFSSARARIASALSAETVVLGDAHEGMSASLRAGVAAANDAQGMIVLLPDMPEITARDIHALIAHFRIDPTKPLRAAGPGGEAGHPVIFPRRLYGALSQLTGDLGGRSILAQENVILHPLADQRALTDLDTPEDWRDWRQQA
jgi:molybdenum cofactor cytidylyltransferase